MPSAKRSAIRSGASGAVMSSSIASPSISAVSAPSSSRGLRDVEADDARAVAGQRPGDRGADPARGAGDQRRLAGERALPVEVGKGRDALPDLDHLP